MNGQEAMEVFELVRKGETLPDVIQALVPISFIGQKAVTFYREKIKLMNQLGVAEEQKKITLADGQDAGRMLLDIEAKIGELLPPVEDIRRAIGNGQKGIPVDSTERGTIEYPKELNLHKRHMARAIANHPEAVAEKKPNTVKQARYSKKPIIKKRANKEKKSILDKRATDLKEPNVLKRAITVKKPTIKKRAVVTSNPRVMSEPLITRNPITKSEPIVTRKPMQLSVLLTGCYPAFHNLFQEATR